MDTHSSSVKAYPFVFTTEEIRALFDENGRFQLRRLRQRQAEKALRIVLFAHHGVMTERPEEVHRHANLLGFSLIKLRPVRWGYYLLTVRYRYQQETWQHTFRFARDFHGGLNGSLSFNSRRRLPNAR